MKQNRDELLAKCPTLKTLLFTCTSVTHSDIIDEVLALVNGDRASIARALKEALLGTPQPKPEPTKLLGIVTIDSRVLCGFCAMTANRRGGTARSLAELADLPWEWEFSGCRFSLDGMKHLRRAFDERLPMTLQWGTKDGDALRSAEVGIGEWDSEWERPGAAVTLLLVGPRDGFRLTGSVKAEEKAE